MAVTISKVDSYKRYGRCVKLENDAVELLITLDLGPRIIYYAAKGGENLFFNDEEDQVVDRSPFFKELFGEEAEYHFYGGHRMWLAPQYQIHTESPDNDPVLLEEIKNGVKLTCPEAKVIGFISAMTVVLDEEKPEIEVTCEFTNTFEEKKRNAVWQVTQCAPGGVGFFPFMRPFRMRKPFSELTLADFSKPILPSGSLVMFLGSLGDQRLGLDDRYITLRHSAERKRPIKIGSADTEGWAMYANKGYLLKMSFTHDTEKDYTDFGSSLEAYTSHQFTEIEVLGPIEDWGKGETISMTEKIAILPLKAEIPDLSDREAVAKFIELHLE